MKQNLLFLAVVLTIIFAFLQQSCENNNELDLYGNQECDTTHISWNSNIKQLLQDKCVRCHNEKLNYNGVRHDTYEEELKVVYDGRLQAAINHTGPFKMPKNEGKLPYCELLLLNKWIENGAPEN
ncbi:MAG: hypothetical protein H6538_04880 [Bacteroidales bacterium]|nr:hypothetical protein [Bacteroidales bacterium]MCB9013764.1 hypothetical protein [Bacteroidales bacterium]